MMRFYTVTLLWLIVFVSSGQHAIQNFRNNPLLRYANISVMVKDVTTGKVIEEYNAHNAVVPASTMKMVTTASALEILGSEYRFSTTLETDGELKTTGVLEGNLYIKGGGDPTLGSEKIGDINFLNQWVDAVKAAGIKKITGNIIAVESCLERQVINPRWTWEDMGNYYAPGIHAISYLDNSYKLFFNAGKFNTTPEIIRTDPVVKGIQFKNYVKCTETKSDNAYLYGAPYSNERSVYGEIPANRTDFFIKGDLPHPAILLAQDFQSALSRANVLVSGISAVQFDDVKCKSIIYTQFSPTLSEIIKEVNVNSNNHFAEYIFKQISLVTNNIGSTDASVAKISSYWKALGLPTDELFQCDGSGLSPTDAVSANFYVDLLVYMKKTSKNAPIFYNSLPVSGNNGTLKTFLSNTYLQGKIHAKSGTIARVKSYTGYIELKNRSLAFAVLVNNANGTSKEVTAKIENLLLDVCKAKNY